MEIRQACGRRARAVLARAAMQAVRCREQGRALLCRQVARKVRCRRRGGAGGGPGQRDRRGSPWGGGSGTGSYGVGDGVDLLAEAAPTTARAGDGGEHVGARVRAADRAPTFGWSWPARQRHGAVRHGHAGRPEHVAFLLAVRALAPVATTARAPGRHRSWTRSGG